MSWRQLNKDQQLSGVMDDQVLPVGQLMMKYNCYLQCGGYEVSCTLSSVLLMN